MRARTIAPELVQMLSHELSVLRTAVQPGSEAERALRRAEELLDTMLTVDEWLAHSTTEQQAALAALADGTPQGGYLAFRESLQRFIVDLRADAAQKEHASDC